MLSISDNLQQFDVSIFDKERFHLLWERMMCSVLGKTDISLKDFYNLTPNNNKEMDDIVK